jgi:aspartyl-tRNA(Asn)/glutamyl-tRNA(Gln) amidotransferase subunit B
MNNSKYEVVIGLEVHAQLLTKSKLFCGDSASFGGQPNTHVSPVTLAHPGTLPKMNKQAIEYAIKLGLALNCDIEQNNYFARKNYFYPDLPKGYQVSQHTTPICKNGRVRIKIGDIDRNVILNRIHMEEDAGKSLHDVDDNYTCIDLNRAGVPLLEIVTEPDLHSAEEAFAFLTELRNIVRWLGVCDGNMEEGSMRCDANISIRLRGAQKLGTRVEVKNLNSIRNVKRAIEHEVQRLITIVDSGEKVIQETRSFDADNGTTFSLRSKEEADDYRYFPDPDLTPFYITDEFLEIIRTSIGELPHLLITKYIKAFHLPEAAAEFIFSDIHKANFFNEIKEHTENYKSVANWLMGPIQSFINEKNIELASFPLSAKQIAQLVQLVDDGKVNFGIASSRIFNALIEAPEKEPLQIATELNLIQESDSSLVETWVDEVLAKMPDKIKEYKNGKKNLIGLFVGEVKKVSKGKADMQVVNKLLADKLNN